MDNFYDNYQPNNQFSNTTYSEPTYSVPPPQEEPEIEYKEPFDYKKYLTVFLIIFIIYFIFSLDPIKNQIGLLFSCINPQEDGTVSKSGFACYGFIIALLCTLTYIAVDKYIVFKF